jgi:peptidyl-dipeptidase Dcp
MNVLLQTWETPFGLPPFADIRDEDFGPAFDEAIARARAAIGAISEGPGTSFAGWQGCSTIWRGRTAPRRERR